jgi:hypothetical protein
MRACRRPRLGRLPLVRWERFGLDHRHGRSHPEVRAERGNARLASALPDAGRSRCEATLGAALLCGSRLCERTGCPGSRLASHESQDGGDELGRCVRRAGVSMIRNPDRPSKTATERGAPALRRRATPAAMAAVISPRPPMGAKTPNSRTRGLSAKSWTKSAPRRPFRLRKSVDLVDESAVGGPLQGLPRAVEDDEGHERDPAHAGRGAVDSAQQ